MSGFNANFRNTALGSQSSFDGQANQRGSGNPPNIPPLLLPFMTLGCGTTTTWELLKQVGFSFFRTDDFLANTRYNARQGNFVIDTPGPVDITVTARGFTPFVSLVRESGFRVTSNDGSGILTATIPVEETGPFTVEVTSDEPYLEGDFDIQISCQTSPFTITVDKVTARQGQKLNFTLVTNDLVNYPPGYHGKLVNSLVTGDPLLDPTQYFIFTTDGSGNASFTGWSRYTGDASFFVRNNPVLFPPESLSNVVHTTITAAPSTQTSTDMLDILTDYTTLETDPLFITAVMPGGYENWSTDETQGGIREIMLTFGDSLNGGNPVVAQTSHTNGVLNFLSITYTKDDDFYGVHDSRGSYTILAYSTNTGFVPPSTITITD